MMQKGKQVWKKVLTYLAVNQRSALTMDFSSDQKQAWM